MTKVQADYNFSNGCKTVAERMELAYRRFIENVLEISGCTEDEAKKVFSVYKSNKVIKLDAVNGVWSVKHGAFWEVAVIKNAIAA